MERKALTLPLLSQQLVSNALWGLIPTKISKLFEICSEQQSLLNEKHEFYKNIPLFNNNNYTDIDTDNERQDREIRESKFVEFLDGIPYPSYYPLCSECARTVDSEVSKGTTDLTRDTLNLEFFLQKFGEIPECNYGELRKASLSQPGSSHFR